MTTRQTKAHKIVRISTRNGKGYCSKCSQPAYRFWIGKVAHYRHGEAK